MRESLSTTRQAFAHACKRNGVAVNVAMEINSREAVIEAVSLGLGFSVIAESEFNRHPKLRAFAVSDAEMYVRSFLVCLQERRERPPIKAVYDLASEFACCRDARADGLWPNGPAENRVGAAPLAAECHLAPCSTSAD